MSTEVQILNYFAKKGSFRPEDVRRKFGLSRAMIHRYLKKWLGQSIIQKSGTPPQVYYSFLKSQTMVLKDMERARKFIKDRPYLVWYTKNYDDLSKESIFEAVLNNGSWDDFISLKKIFGIKTLRLLFEVATGKKRSNIQPMTENYFRQYFVKYA